MSKVILWIGFILSIFFLLFGVFVAENAKPLFFLLWLVILIGSSYKLFIAKSKA